MTRFVLHGCSFLDGVCRKNRKTSFLFFREGIRDSELMPSLGHLYRAFSSVSGRRKVGGPQESVPPSSRTGNGIKKTARREFTPRIRRLLCIPPLSREFLFFFVQTAVTPPGPSQLLSGTKRISFSSRKCFDADHRCRSPFYVPRLIRTCFLAVGSCAVEIWYFRAARMTRPVINFTLSRLSERLTRNEWEGYILVHF